MHAVVTSRGVVGGDASRAECTLTCVCVCVCAPERARTELQIMCLGGKVSLQGTDSLRHVWKVVFFFFLQGIDFFFFF